MGISVPYPLRLWLKRKAAEEDTTMNSVLIGIIQSHIDALEAQKKAQT